MSRHNHGPDDSDRDDDDHDETYTDPLLRKFHYIDPGMLQYQRASLETLFYQETVPLTGPELKHLAEGRRLKLSVEDDSVILLVYLSSWVDATDEMWASMAELLSDWATENHIRASLPTVLANPILFHDHNHYHNQENIPVKIPLKVRHDPPSF
jgi:hypothetical protein